MSVGSAVCLLTVENVTGGCLETAAIVGMRGQALEGLKEVLMDVVRVLECLNFA